MPPWKKVKLGDVLGSKGYIRGPFGSALKRGEMKESGIPVYEQQHAIYNTREFRFFIDDDKFKELKRFQVQTNDLVISCSGTLGKITIIKGDDPKGIISQALLLLRPNIDLIIPNFLYYFFQDISGSNQLLGASHGSVQMNIGKRSIVEDINIELPDLPTQSRIASILSAFDDKIELNRQMNTTLEQMAQALFKKYFVTGIDPDNLPEGWRWGKMSELIRVKDGTHDSPKQNEKGFPLVTSKHLKGNYIDFTSTYNISKEDFNTINKRSKVDTLDILISMIGTVGNIYLVSESPVNFAIKNIGLFKTSERQDLVYYILSYLNSGFAKNYIEINMAGSTQQYITLEALRNYPVILTNNNNMVKFNKEVESIYSQITINEEENLTLSIIRNTILPKLMNGKLPADSVSLEESPEAIVA